MIRRLVLALLTLLLILAAGLVTALFIFRVPTPAKFEQATANRPVTLPRDEAAHLNATTEWWYYTGFMIGADGKRYGFELVFFKAFASPQAKMASVLPINWVSNPVYVAHFAVSDLAARDHVSFEQSNFPQFWSASAKDDRHAVWVAARRQGFSFVRPGTPPAHRGCGLASIQRRRPRAPRTKARRARHSSQGRKPLVRGPR